MYICISSGKILPNFKLNIKEWALYQNVRKNQQTQYRRTNYVYRGFQENLYDKMPTGCP